MIQHMFDFQAAEIAAKETGKVQQDTSLPPPLVNSKRQIIYEGDIADWPAASLIEDATSITVDRGAGMDGPAHRFVIKTGDEVEVAVGVTSIRLGRVLEVLTETREIRVRFLQHGDESTVMVEAVFPALPDKGLKPKTYDELVKQNAQLQEGLKAESENATRCLSYDGQPSYEWPDAEALHDRDTITVDRVSDINGQTPHRFVIKRGDRVKAWFSKDKIEEGCVVGISHAKNEVSVRFLDGKEGIWFHTGQIYPGQPKTTPSPNGVPLSKIINELNEKHTDPDLEASPVSAPLSPYLFSDHKQTVEKLRDGTITVPQIQDGFIRLLESKEAFIADLVTRLKAPKLKSLATRLGDWNAKSQRKDENAASIHRKLLHDFHLSDTFSYSFDQSVEEVLKEKVLAQTKEDLDAYFGSRSKAKEKAEKAIRNPETLPEFCEFIRQNGESDLSDNQLAFFDALNADLSRERRAKEKGSETVGRFESAELDGLELAIKEGFHDKKKIQLWIVQLGGRLETATFRELKVKAKMLGGC